MKRDIRGFVIGFLVATLLSSPVLGDGIQDTINVIFNKVHIAINGRLIQGNTLLYDGRTYAPVREVAEMLNKEVIWDNKNNIVNIVEGENGEDIITYNPGIERFYKSDRGNWVFEFPSTWKTKDYSTNQSISAIAYPSEGMNAIITLSSKTLKDDFRMGNIESAYLKEFIATSFKGYDGLEKLQKDYIDIENAKGLLVEYKGYTNVDGEKMSKHFYVASLGRNKQIVHILTMSREEDWAVYHEAFRAAINSFKFIDE